MTAFTTTYNLRKPQGTDAPDLVVLVGNLADDVDTLLTTQLPALATTYRANNTLVGSAASVTFAGIPSTLKLVQVNWTARSDNAVTSQQFLVRVNGDAGTNYRWAAAQNNNGSFAGGVGNGVAFMALGLMAGNNASAGIFASGMVTWQGWDSPHAGFLGCTGQSQLLIDGSTYNVYTSSGHYSPAGPYTSITLLPQAGNFLAGSEFTLVGWK